MYQLFDRRCNLHDDKLGRVVLMKHVKTRYIVGGTICVAILLAIILGGDGALRASLAIIVGFLFGQATK